MMADLGEVKNRHGGGTVVLGGQVGSEGKGAIAGHLARRRNWGAAIWAFMTNAGHNWMSSAGEEVMVREVIFRHVDVQRVGRHHPSLAHHATLSRVV